MKPSKFSYHAPGTVAEVLTLLDQLGDEAKVLAGGQSLIPILAMRLTAFSDLIDLNRIDELAGVERRNGSVRIGAMTRQRDAGEHAEVLTSVPLLAKAIPHIGHMQIRNRGTIGGSLAHADPASELPAVARALDAELEVVGPGGSRRVPAAEFFESTWTTSLASSEVLTAAEFPVWGDRSGFAVEEIARRHGDFAIVGTAVGIQLGGGGEVARAAISLFGVSSTPIRATAAEQLLIGRSAAHPLDDVAETALADVEPGDDVHATGRYRRVAGAELVRRALTIAMEEASHG